MKNRSIILNMTRMGPEAGTMHQPKSGGAEMGVTEKFLRPRPLECRKTPLLENTCLFLLNFYKQSVSEEK